MPYTPIAISRAEDGVVVITTPVRRGASIDWKATAHALAEQHSDMLEDHTESLASNRRMCERIAQLGKHRDDLVALVHSLRAHWTTHFWPSALATKADKLAGL